MVNNDNSKLSLRQSMRWAWTAFKNNPLFYIGIVLTFFASWVILELFVIRGQKLGGIFNLGIHILFLVVFSGLQVGFINICLDVCKGDDPSYMELFKSLNQGAKFLIRQLVYWIMVLVGLLLLLFPGLYLGTRFAFFGFDLAEKKSTFMDSLLASAQLTHKSIPKLATYFFILLLFNLAGAAVLGLGLLITVPITSLAITSLYQGLKSKRFPDSN